MHRFRFLLATAAIAVLAAGCIRSDLTVSVNDDGSGTYSAIVAFNPKAFAQFAQLAGENASQLGDDPCKEIRDSAKENQAELPTGAKVENYSDGDFCGVKITAPFASGDNPSEAISKALGGMDSATEGFSGIGLDTFSIKKSGTGWQFEAKPAGSSGSSSSSSTDAAMMQQFLKGASSIVRIKLPGRMVEKDSNPDAVDGGGVMIWNLNLAGETRTLKARTEAGDPITNKVFTDAGKSLPNIKGAGVGTTGSSGGDSGGSSSLPWIIGGVVVVIAAIAGFALWRKSKGAGPAPAMAGAPPAAGMGMGMGMGPGGPVPAPSAPPAAAPANTWPSAPAPTDATTAMPAATPPASAGGADPGQPQWDPARNAYILWDAGSSKWLQYDNAAGAWKPIE